MKKANLQKSRIIHFTLPNQFIIQHVRWSNPHKIFCHCFFVLKRNKQALGQRSAEVKLEFKKREKLLLHVLLFCTVYNFPMKKRTEEKLETLT